MAERILITGPKPASNSARALAATGTALGGGIGLGLAEELKARRQEQMYSPMREAIEQSLKGNPTLNPMQQMISSVVSDPRVFSTVMQDPNQMQSLATLGDMMTPPTVEDPNADLTIITEALTRASAARAAGNTAAADLLEAKAASLAGFDVDKPGGFETLQEMKAAVDGARMARESGDVQLAELYESRARQLAGKEDESTSAEVATIMEALDKERFYRGLGQNERADYFRDLAADTAGRDTTALSDYAQRVIDMGEDPKTGRGRELMESMILGANRADQRTQRIEALAAQLGGDVQKATNIVDGLVRMEPNPRTGTITLIDEVNGTVSEVPMAARSAVVNDAALGPALGAVPQLTGEGGQTLWDLTPHATGVKASINNALSFPLSLIGLPFAEQTVFARQIFDTEVQNFLKAMALNQRFPVAEMERLRKEVNTLPTWYNSPDRLRVGMQGLNRSLSTTMSQYQQNAANLNLPEDDRAAWETAATNIGDFLTILGVPADQQNPAPGQNATTGALPEGIPAGSRLIGTVASGAQVYETPDGRRLVAE